jgi:hypothetical protein
MLAAACHLGGNGARWRWALMKYRRGKSRKRRKPCRPLSGQSTVRQIRLAAGTTRRPAHLRDAIPDPERQGFSPAASIDVARHPYRNVSKNLIKGEFALFSEKKKNISDGRQRRMWNRKRLMANRDCGGSLKRRLCDQPTLSEPPEDATKDSYLQTFRLCQTELSPGVLAIAHTKAVDFFLQTRTFKMCKDKGIR